MTTSLLTDLSGTDAARHIGTGGGGAAPTDWPSRSPSFGRADGEQRRDRQEAKSTVRGFPLLALDAPVHRDLLEQLEQQSLLEIAEVAEQLLFHAVGDPVGLAHERGPLGRQRDVLLAPIVLAARSRDELAIDELVADDGQA